MRPATPELEQITATPAEEVAPTTEQIAEETEAAAKLSSEGAVPEVAEPTTAAADATASEQAFADPPKADTAQLDSGMHRVDDYRATCESAAPDKWDPKYAQGHTSAAGWIQPYEAQRDSYDMYFELKAGQSASDAIQAFIKGPTIADFRSIGIALELEELRSEWGNSKFDAMLGSNDPDIDAGVAQRMTICSAMFTTPFIDQLKALADEREAADLAGPEPIAPVVEPRVEDQQAQIAEAEQKEEIAPELLAEELAVQRELERQQQLA